MHHHHDKLSDATVQAGFNTQNEAEDALLGLRAAGFRDSQIGYYAMMSGGFMRDFLASFDRFGAAVLWGLIGVGGGLVVSWMVYLSGFHQDRWGTAITCGVIGALLVGTIGGCAGLWRPREGTYIVLPNAGTEPYVMAVNAGAAGRDALDIMRRHGGHEVHLQGHTALA